MTWPNLGNKPGWGFLQLWLQSAQPCTWGTIQETATVAHICYGDMQPAQRPPNTNMIINLGGFIPFGGIDLTKESQLKARFAAAKTWMGNHSDGKPFFDIGNFLLSEEVWSPWYLAVDKRVLMSSWTRSGTFTLGDGNVQLQLIDTWCAANGRTIQSFTTGDATVQAWNSYYQTQLMKAWHKHMLLNGKESGFLGAGWAGLWSIPMSYAEDRPNHFPGKKDDETTPYGYLIKNYDVIYCYQYPQSISQVPSAVDQVKQIRNDGFQGKIIYISTSHWDQYGGYWNLATATAEYAAVAPYVNYIVAYSYLSNESGCDHPQILQQIWANYNPPGGCPPLSASLTM